MKILVCELLKLFVPKHHRWEKYDFWTYIIFCKDPIDIHEQIYGTLNLSMYRSYPQSDFLVTFFSKELSHKINCPVRNEIVRFFSRKNNFSYIFLIYFGLKSCFSYNLIICEHDAWHYLIKFWKKCFTTLVWNTEESPGIKEQPPWCMPFADDIMLCSTRRDHVERKLEEWRRAME